MAQIPASDGEPGRLLSGASGATALTQETASSEIRSLAARSEMILLGTCVSTRSRWDNEARMILTDVTLEVARYLKGSGRSRLTLIVPGGELPERNFGMVAPGMTQFRENEEVIVFARLVDGAVHVVGGAQGKYLIRVRPGTGTKTIRRRPLRRVIEDIERVVSTRP